MGNFLRYVTTCILLLAIAPMPDLYYAVMGYTVSLLFVLIAATDVRTGNAMGVVLCLTLAGLFQPFYKIEMSSLLWIVVYAISALWLIFEIGFIKGQRRRNQAWAEKQRLRREKAQSLEDD